ncbi:MAG: cupin domain-containing protein [Gammaproteobacteria bacterium]|nr:cupin domain-containing protein [Gammaproteobacteria bacterium]
MHVNNNASATLHELPGLAHQTLAGHQDGLKSFEIWRQTLAPHAATPLHCHACEEVIVVLSGSGVCRFEDRELSFKADQTLVIPGDVVHQICNTGATDLHIMATLAASPVAVKTATGEPMALPW